MFDDAGPVIVVNGRGGDDGIDVQVTTEVGLRTFQLKYHPDGFPGSLKGRRASIKKSFNRAMAHKLDERALFPGRGRITHPACLLLLHSRRDNHLISALGLLMQTNRPLSKLHVLTHPRRKINTDKPIQLNRSTRSGPERRGGSGSPLRPDAMLSPWPFPMKTCRPGPASGILSGAAISSNALSCRHHSPRPHPRPTGGAVAKPRAADLRTVHGHTKKEK